VALPESHRRGLVVHPSTGPTLRVVVPTTQIFLEPTDYFDTAKFNPWRQKNIYAYTRRDVPDSFTLQPKLFEFFIRQLEEYASASDSTLQQLRYFRGLCYRKLGRQNEQPRLRRMYAPGFPAPRRKTFRRWITLSAICVRNRLPRSDLPVTLLSTFSRIYSSGP
jgi:hypothetical protein